MHGRKFDLRCYVRLWAGRSPPCHARPHSRNPGTRFVGVRVWQVLLVSTNRGRGLTGYLYRDGYIRTSCKKFALGSLNDRLIHLTNDAVRWS